MGPYFDLIYKSYYVFIDLGKVTRLPYILVTYLNQIIYKIMFKNQFISLKVSMTSLPSGLVLLNVPIFGIVIFNSKISKNPKNI